MTVPSWVKPSIWGAIWGAVGIAVLGFWQFGWVTSGTANQMAAERAEEAVTAALTPICVANFRRQPDASVKLAELKKLTSSWDQRTFVEKGGWASVPGTPEPDYDLIEACAERLAKMPLTNKT